MDKIGMFFGTETGTTRLIAKKIHKKLGDELADKPVNVNRIEAEELLQYDCLILGTPSYGVGDIPGKTAGCIESNWEEFLAKLQSPDFTGKCIAFFGLGAQERYADRFCSSLIRLHNYFAERGAEVIGQWSTEGYIFQNSASVVDGKFVGLVIDQRTQGFLTEERLEKWLAEITPVMRSRLHPSLQACTG